MVTDKIGLRFGRLTIVERAPDYHTPNGTLQIKYRCKCECGNFHVARYQDLKLGRIKSCGCLKHETRPSRIRGMRKSKAYSTWSGIKTRCYNSNAERYKDYGGRGIAMCEDWKNDFLKFYDYVSKLENSFKDGYSIDRICNDKGYEPGNVRWATHKEQNCNTRRTVYFEVDGKIYNSRSYADEHGMNIKTVYNRFVVKPRREKKNGVKNRSKRTSSADFV